MVKVKYVLGVDGGNTKTDYLLFDSEGNFIDGMRSGTCSHEGLKDSFDGAKRVMRACINELLDKHGLKISDIEVGAFGLAGVDVPYQKQRLEGIIKELGFKQFEVNNDGLLGIKATSPTGVGVCSINGTGTVTIGLDQNNDFVQVGGVGYISGDEAGGAFLTRRVFQAVYDELYRLGDKTSLTKIVFDMIGIEKKQEYLEKLIEHLGKKLIDRTDVIKHLFSEGNKGDKVAIEILRTAGASMGRSVAGCIQNLNFNDVIPIILAGSVWANATCEHMLDSFKQIVSNNANQPCDYMVLTVPPASGAVLWALELAHQKMPDYTLREHVLKQVEEYQKDII